MRFFKGSVNPVRMKHPHCQDKQYKETVHGYKAFEKTEYRVNGPEYGRVAKEDLPFDSSDIVEDISHLDVF